MQLSEFWNHVDKTGECWLWTGALNQGYGYIYLGTGQARHHVNAHRVAYELMVGPIPEGLTIDHLCRNHACVNPAHLEAVTNKENVLRGEGITAQQKRRTHCPYGHEYSPDNTYLSRGKRYCKTCMRQKRQRWGRRKRDQKIAELEASVTLSTKELPHQQP